MQTKEFNHFWKLNYPDTLPLGSELRLQHPERWFRIHSLPKSKRYADTLEEYETILARQNQLFEDVIGAGTKTIILFCKFTNDTITENYSKIKGFISFTKTKTYNLHQIEPDNYEDKTEMEVFIKSEIWKSNSSNAILKALADDEIRAIFICSSKNRIIAPYDGGVDIIMEDENKKNEFKYKYKKWLSYRKDGL